MTQSANQMTARLNNAVNQLMDGESVWKFEIERRRFEMKKLQILGTGCPKCKELGTRTEQAARELGIEYEIVKIDNITDIMSFGVMTTPALAVDGVVKVAGKLPGVEEIKGLIG
jgi:small redox-active disulfide protein 2